MDVEAVLILVQAVQEHVKANVVMDAPVVQDVLVVLVVEAVLDALEHVVDNAAAVLVHVPVNAEVLVLEYVLDALERALEHVLLVQIAVEQIVLQHVK